MTPHGPLRAPIIARSARGGPLGWGAAPTRVAGTARPFVCAMLPRWMRTRISPSVLPLTGGWWARSRVISSGSAGERGAVPGVSGPSWETRTRDPACTFDPGGPVIRVFAA